MKSNAIKEVKKVKTLSKQQLTTVKGGGIIIEDDVLLNGSSNS